ncbi:MAG: hypothetical protein IJ391_07830 [Clostridia bacterium]|nr:hypothetical protein [Clostridia bacterium]
MKTISCALAFFAIILCALPLTSCSDSTTLSDISESFDKLVQDRGGNVVVYRHGDADVPASVISLYGRAGTAPDELALVDYAVIWYSDRLAAQDAAVFRVTNATDVQSVLKMCRRRADTLKYAAGISMTVSYNGHYVYIYTDGLDEFLP